MEVFYGGEHMKKVLVIFTALLCMLFTGMLGNTSYAAKKIIALPGIHSNMGYDGDRAAKDFESQLIGVLISSGQYDVVERDRLDKVLSEMGLSATGLISEDNAIQFGELSGADYTLTGSLLDARIVPFDNIIYSGKKAVVKFDIRLVDNRTGKIIFAEIVGGSKTVAKELGGLDGTASISEAVNDAAKEVIKLLNEKNPLTGNVAHVTDSQVYLDLGSDNGVRVGEKFIVYREGQPIMNPVTHELMAVEENNVGMVKIMEVKSNYSICTYSNGKGQIKVGDKAKRGHK